MSSVLLTGGPVVVVEYQCYMRSVEHLWHSADESWVMSVSLIRRSCLSKVFSYRPFKAGKMMLYE